VGALDDAGMNAAVLGFAGFEHDHLRSEDTAERLTVGGELDPAAAVASDRGLAVPDQGARHRAECVDQSPPPGEQVLRLAGGDQHR
jgi:hypothetical protein